MAVPFPGDVGNLMAGAEALGRLFPCLPLWLEARSLISNNHTPRNSDEVCIQASATPEQSKVDKNRGSGSPREGTPSGETLMNSGISLA